jgi:hypothetical protein
MADKPDTRVSLTLDPERFRLIDGYNDDTRPFVDDVVSAYSDIYHTLQKIHDARVHAERNPAWTPENRILIVGRETAKQKERTLTRLARAERDLRARIAHTESELTKPLVERAGMGTLNAEVRAHFKGLDRPERTRLLREAMERGDGATLEAVLGGQYFLSGLTEIDHQHFVREYHERSNPQLVRRLDLMNRFLGEIERNGQVVIDQFDKAVGARPADVAAIHAANARAEAALKIEPTD